MNDLMLNTSNDLLIENDDLVIAESTRQHQMCLLKTSKGQLKESPLVGVGVEMYLNSENEIGGLLGDIKQEFEKDGMAVKSLSFSDNKINIDASY